MKMLIHSILFLAVVAVAVSACARSEVSRSERPAELATAADQIQAADLMSHIEVLASDEFEGRAPGTQGEELTVDYLTDQFSRLGLQPGNPDGTYVQEVPLVGITPNPTASFEAGGRSIDLSFPDDYVATSMTAQPEVVVENSDIVFVGYGVVAPEYDWDDYKDVDVSGKTIVMLINDPAVPDASDPSKLDDSVFKGRVMTYYGRWTYKYEIASELGAAAAVIVHETGPAGYPYAVVAGGWGQESFDIESTDSNAGRLPIESWITVDKARELFAAAGHDFDDLKQQAITRDFRPVALDAMANFRVKNEVRHVLSRNVIARLEGSDPEVSDEHLIYTAHWDHLGRDESLEGDQIYNGAHDNASGTAALIEIAEAFTALPEAPRRSVLFMALAAEEQGLLGAKHYATSPLYPLEKTVANINIDGMNQWGRTRDIVVVGYGNSTLDDLLEAEAEAQGRTVVPDPEPEKGYFYRSDHFELAKQGVPALYTDTGTEYIGQPAEYSQQKRNEYTENDYHKPSDEIKPDWDLSGAEEDSRLLFFLGHRILQGQEWPEWKPGTEFKAKREEMLAK